MKIKKYKHVCPDCKRTFSDELKPEEVDAEDFKCSKCACQACGGSGDCSSCVGTGCEDCLWEGDCNECGGDGLPH